MSLQCFICDTQVGKSSQGETSYDTENIGECINIDLPLADLLCEIVDKKTLDLSNLHSNVICKPCYTTTMEYDKMKKRIKEVKTELTDNFKSTITKHGFLYSLYPVKSSPTTAVKASKKLVLPASKLQPLPPGFVLDVNKIPKNLSIPTPKKNNVSPSSTPSTKPYKSKQNSSKSDSTSSSINNTVESNIADSLSSILGVKTSTSVTRDTSMLTFSVSDSVEDGGVKVEVVGDDEERNADELPMEIDEGTSRTIMLEDDAQDTLEDDQYKDGEGDGDGDQYVTAELVSVNEEDYDNDEETETIVMTGDNGSILRLVTGQKFVYQDGEFTLADDDSNQGDGGHDSNDESQIELQVSGDEETANAIIAAAQEQGGAFIKVESGEMFRVKSVKSKSNPSESSKEMENDTITATDDNSGDSDPVMQLVAVKDNEFHCLVCANRNKDETEKSAVEVFVSSNAEEMMQHLRNKHNARLYLCQLCKKVMCRKSDYCVHLTEHSKKFHNGRERRVHKCNRCNKSYNSKTLLLEHVNTHTGSKPYQCAVCQKGFASKYTHQAHLKTHLERPRPYQCQQCSKSFLSQQNLLQHEKTHLGIRDFHCNMCGKAFTTQHNLQVHGVVHSKNKPFVCGVCGKGFARKAEIRDHMRVHTGERPYACDVCGAAFKQRSNLLSHKRATHLNDKRYHCAHCPKQFKRRRLLDYHIKASHTGERPLECGICHATFVYPEHYKKHARIHSGEKPYVCEVCGKTFNSRDNRNTHRFVHSDKKPYECLVCGAGYMRKQLLYAHMNSSNHLAESIVVNQPRVQKENSRRQVKVDTEADTTVTAQEEVVNSVNVIQDAGIIQDPTTAGMIQAAAAGDDQSALYTLIHSLDGATKSETPEGTISQPVQMMTADETGAIRLVQLHLNAPVTWTVSDIN